MEHNYLDFNIDVGKSKPENIVHKNNTCPFCDVEHLTNIIDTKGNMILLENKYQVLQGAYQLLVIESDKCDDDIPNYTAEHMHDLMHFAIGHWLKMLDSKEYKSVLFFKNHGPLSGGTMRHPHMQIIGIKERKLKDVYDTRQFEGYMLHTKNSVTMNLSTKPRVGFTEINIIMEDLQDIDTLADHLQIGVDYIMHHFAANCNSYNLFFYLIEGKIYVKIMPRFATSPLFIGYNIELVPNNLEQMANEIKSIYFSDEQKEKND